jgi:CBS domain-containing protein
MLTEKGVFSMQVKDVMSTDLAYISERDSTYEAACLMRDHQIGMIPVVENNKCIGVVTDRDLVVRGIAERRPNSLAASKLMSSRLVKATPDMSTDEVAQLMADAQVRRIPVVDEEDHLIGIISLGDLAVREATSDEAAEAIGEISQTHHLHASNDLDASQQPLH